MMHAHVVARRCCPWHGFDTCTCSAPGHYVPVVFVYEDNGSLPAGNSLALEDAIDALPRVERSLLRTEPRAPRAPRPSPREQRRLWREQSARGRA